MSHKNKMPKIGTIVEKTMGVRLKGVVIKSFYWRESNDGTYKAPEKDDICVLWNDGTKGYINKWVVLYHKALPATFKYM